MTSPITKPTVGATGWNVAVDAVIDRVNDLPEIVRDIVGTALVAGTDVAVAVNDSGDTVTVSSTAPFRSDNLTVTGTTVGGMYVLELLTTSPPTYRLTAATGGGGGVTVEEVRDTIGTALVAGTGVSVTVNDPADTITVAVTGIPDGSVTNAKVATGAAISADKLADGSTSKVMTAAERTKLAGLATVATSGKLADITDVDSSSPSVGKVLAVAQISPLLVGFTDPIDQLPEFSSSAQTAAVGTPASLLRKTTRYSTAGGAINQTLPAATAGAIIALGWDAGTNALTFTAAGSDVIGSGSTTSFVMPLLGEVITFHCTTAGRWRSVSGMKTQTSLDARYPINSTNTTLAGASVGRPVAASAVSGGSATSFGIGPAVMPQLAEQSLKTAAYTATAGQLVPVSTTSATIPVTFPAIPATGDPVYVGTRWESGTAAATVAAVGGDKIGASTATTATIPLPGETIIWQGTPGGTVGTGRWRALSSNKPQSALDTRYQRIYGATGGRVLAGKRSGVTDNKAAAGDGAQVVTACASFTATLIPTARVIGNVGLDMATNAGAITVPAGADAWYDLEASARLSGGSVGERNLEIRRNGTSIVLGGGYGISSNFQTSGAAYLRAGDYLDMILYPAQACSATARVGSYYDITLSAIRRGVLPVQPIKIGWVDGGTRHVAATVPQKSLDTYTSRDTWAHVAAIEFIASNTEWTSWIAANPAGLSNVATALIPHDGNAQSLWNGLLDEVIAGTHDAKFTQQGQVLAQYSTNDVVARPWWEMNLYDTTNLNPAKFIAAWQRAIPLIRSAFATAAPTKRLRIAFCYLPDASADFRVYYPGNTTVDVIDADLYCQIYGTTQPSTATLLAKVRDRCDELEQFAAYYGKPIGISEWGNFAAVAPGAATARGMGDVPDYIDIMFDFFEQHQVEYAQYFDLNAGGTAQTLGNTPLSLARFNARAALL